MKDVVLYVGFTDQAALQETFAIKKILDDNKIPYIPQFYLDQQLYQSIYDTMSANVYGPDFTSYTVTNFPFITWVEAYDDYERFAQVAFSAVEVTNSNLVKFKELFGS
jgi:hypothetical protein